MLKPTALTAAQLSLARDAVLGFEEQLYVSPEQAVELGTYTIDAAASGTWTPVVAGAATLSANPQQIIAILQTDFNLGATDLVLSVTGTDASNGALTSINGTVAVPSYSQETRRYFARSWATQLGVNEVFKTVTGLTHVGGAGAIGSKIRIFGVPPLPSFQQIGCKTTMSYPLLAPMPTAVQCGRKMGAYIKEGEIPVGEFDITTKSLTFGEGLARYNGLRVTGLVKQIRNDKLATMYIFFIGLVVTVKPTAPEGAEPATLAGTGMAEDCGILLADGP